MEKKYNEQKRNQKIYQKNRAVEPNKKQGNDAWRTKVDGQKTSSFDYLNFLEVS